MRKINTIIIVVLIFTVVVLPLAVLPKGEKAAVTSEPTTSEVVESAENTAESDKESKSESAEESGEKVRVFDPDTGKVEEKDMREYIYGVVCAECPMLYHEEAIKAQIVAAYTYTLYCMNANKSAQYDLTTKPETSQAYITKEQAFKNWGSNAEKYDKRLNTLINGVWGEHLTYENKPILASYHAISAGKTESAEAVWGKAIPYLTSVDSEGDKLAEKYETKVETTLADAEKALETLGFTASELKKAKKETTDCGTVKSIVYKEKSTTGEQIRAAFNLRSANFKIKVTSKKVIFTVLGYGHGLGMSQNGANFLAKTGLDYKEILAHYYRNTSLKNIYKKE